MMRRRADLVNRFLSVFDEKTGVYYRSGVMDRGRDTGRDPFMARFPEVIEVEIKGGCIYEMRGKRFLSGERCYQDGLTRKQSASAQGKQSASAQEKRSASAQEKRSAGPPERQSDMAAEDFASIAEQSRGKAYQIILGGRGEAYLHKHFEEMLKICIENEIVPNVECSGLGITKETAVLCGKYCGAVGVSWHGSSDATKAIRMFREAGVKINLHFALGMQTIQEALDRLERVDFPQGVNAVIFLTHKSVGREEEGSVLSFEDERVRRFCSLIDGKRYPFKVGFDSCSIQWLLDFTKNIDFNSADACEGARWSAYITSDMKMAPCSCGCENERWCVNLRKHSIQEAWGSSEFRAFRGILKSICPGCGDRERCGGGCPVKASLGQDAPKGL